MAQISLSLAMGYGKDITHQITLRVMPPANLLYEKLFAFGERHFADFPPGHYANVTETAKTASGLTTYLGKNYAKIVVENLNVSGVMKNEKLASVIADCGFYEFKRQLEYKAKKFSCEIIVADRRFPSSQICSCCGHQQKVPFFRKNVLHFA